MPLFTEAQLDAMIASLPEEHRADVREATVKEQARIRAELEQLEPHDEQLEPVRIEGSEPVTHKEGQHAGDGEEAK